MMEQKDTRRRIRIAAELEPSLLRKVDDERRGKFSRATLIRIALLERYSKKAKRVA